MVFFQRHCRPISFGVSPPLKSGTLFIYSFGWRPSGATTRRKPKKPCACENWYKKSHFGATRPTFSICHAGNAAGAQSDVETCMPRPHQGRGRGWGSVLYREGGYAKKICTRFPPGRRAVWAENLFVLWLLLVFWVGNWAKKTQERTRSRRSRLNKTQSHQSRHSPFSRPSVLVAFG